jgi:hypothetical protein
VTPSLTNADLSRIDNGGRSFCTFTGAIATMDAARRGVESVYRQ